MADSILRLKVESQEYDQKIKRAAEGIQQYAQKCREAGGTLQVVEKDTLDFVKSLGRMETVSKTAKGGLSEMTKAFTDLKMQYKQLTDAEKQSPFGRELNNSLNQLKSRIIETKNNLKGIEGELNGSKFGQFGSVIDTIGHKLGLTTNATELLTSKTALMYSGIGAGIAIIGKATQEWAKYNAELAKQDQITTVTTGLKDDDAKRMTDTMRALSDTYNVDFRDAINAANTLMSQFGVSGDEAIRLIKDGMKGMIYGDGGKLLSMIQQYAPAFQSAGVSASQLVAVIHNSEGGIFTDQNMNAIVMGIKNIRLMTKSTSEALANLGLDGQDMAQKMSNGSMTVFDALKMVAGQLKNVDSNSQAAGEVMQTVFGRQGAMAGTNLAKAIEGLNTDLEQTKKQLGDVGDAYDKLQEANERLNVAIRDAFGYDGWEQMATGIKTTLIGALSDVIEHLAIIEEGFGKIGKFFGIGGGGSKQPRQSDIAAEQLQKWINEGKDDAERLSRYNAAIADLQRSLNNIGKEYSVKNADGTISFKIDDVKTQNQKRSDINNIIKQLYATSYTPEPDIIKPLPTRPTHTTASTAKADKEAEQTARMLVELRKQEAKATKEIADARAREHRTETTGTSGFNEQNIANWTAMMKDQLSKADFGSVVYNSIEENMRDMTTITDLTKEALKRGLNPESLGLTEMFETAFDNIDVPDNTLQAIVEKINAAIKDGVKLEINAETGKVTEKKQEKKNDTLGDTKKVVSGLSQVAGGLQQIGVELPEGVQKVMGVIQGLMTVIEGVNTIIGLTQTPAIVANTVAMDALTAALWTTGFFGFSQGGVVHAANGFSGVVPGNHFSGDNVPALLDSGEVVLNRAQQGVIAGALQGGGQTVRVVGKLSGESLFLCAENWAKRTGKGEFVTWR